MTDSSTHDTVHRTIIDLLNDHYPDHEPVVRYAFPDDNGTPKQEPRLRSIHDHIPAGASWVSAIYVVTENQFDRLNQYADKPYENLSSDNIAKTIQDECEDAGRVFYSVHAESDAHEADEDGGDIVPLPTMVDWLQEFVRMVIEIDPGDCTFYYSGNRSIHAHTPLFVTGDNLGWLKAQTEQFCDESGAELDASVYKSKQQFRLPGAIHESRGLQKAEIDPDWGHTEIIRAATDAPHPETYAEVLKTIFGPQDSADLADLLVSSSATDTQTQSSSVLSTWPSRYMRPQASDQRRAHTAPSFYPYPTGDDHDGRSISAVRVVAEPFQRRAAGRNRTFVPCFFYGAHSCSGRDYTKDEHYAPLQLSKPDATKWDYEQGDRVVVIGGGNYESITYKVAESTAEQVGDLLDPEDGDRDDAIDYLQAEGYDVGSAGPSQTHSTPNQQSAAPDGGTDQPESETRAARLQRRAEQGSVEMSLAHGERRDVANRLLTIGGWDYAWNWFREQYGDDFDPQRTWNGFRSIIETHSDHDEDIDAITVPPQP